MPVIASTAATSDSATAACDTITPRSSLIVLLEVLPHAALLLERLVQPLVEPLRRIHAAVAQQMVHRHHFTDHGQVLAGIERHRHQRQPHAENLGLLSVQPGAIVLARVVPILELHHDLDAFLLPHRAHAEQRVDVDQPDAADLHVVPGDLDAPADQHVVAAPGDVHHVVGDETVAALDQIEHAFALADPRAPRE